MRGINRNLSQIEFIRPNNQSKGVVKNAMQQHELLAKLEHINNTARANFIKQPHDETLARDALRSEIQLGVPDKLHSANLTYNGTRARDLIGLISKQVEEHGTSADKEKLLSVSYKLANLAGREKDEKKIASQLDDLVSKFARCSGEAFINNFMETHCYPAWLKYHESQGIDVKGKETFNEQLNACRTVLNARLDVMSEPGKPWELLTQNMSMLIDECAAVSKALIRYDFDAPLEKPATTPEAVKAAPDSQRYDIHGGAEKGGVTLHINNSNSNRNGDISNTPMLQGGDHVVLDPHTRRLEIVEKLNISGKEKYELAKRIIDGCYGSRVIDHIDSVRVYNQESVIEQSSVIPPFAQKNDAQPIDSNVNPRADEVDFQRMNVHTLEPDGRIPDPARNVSTRAQEPPLPAEETRTRSLDEQLSSAASHNVATQTPAASSADVNKTPRIYTTERTLNQWSRRNPVEVNHYVPMNKPVEAFPTLKPVNSQRSAASPTPGQNIMQPPVDQLMVSINDVLRPGARVRQAVKVTSSYLPERSVAELIILGDVGQEEPSVSSVVDEADGPVPNIIRHVAREAGDVREINSEETSAQQQRAAVGTSDNPSTQVNAANPFSITERIKYFEDMQKSGSQTTSARVSRLTSSTIPNQMNATIMASSQWGIDEPELKSFVPWNTDASTSGAVLRGYVTNSSMKDTNLAGEYGDE